MNYLNAFVFLEFLVKVISATILRKSVNIVITSNVFLMKLHSAVKWQVELKLNVTAVISTTFPFLDSKTQTKRPKRDHN